MKGSEKYGRKTAHNRKWFILFLVHKSNMHGLRDRDSFGNAGIVRNWRGSEVVCNKTLQLGIRCIDSVKRNAPKCKFNCIRLYNLSNDCLCVFTALYSTIPYSRTQNIFLLRFQLLYIKYLPETNFSGKKD